MICDTISFELMTVYLQNWYDNFFKELATTTQLRIISPFVKEQILRNVHKAFDLKNFELITRFDLAEFACGVSSLEGVRFAVGCGAEIYGVQHLHSKIYLFDRRAAIISSANLTYGGLVGNLECGIYISDRNIIDQLHAYFDELKNIAGYRLSIDRCDAWQNEIASKQEILNSFVHTLPDYGGSAVKLDTQRNYFVKFFGTGSNRVGFDFSVRDEIERALCHYACCFSRTPKQFRTGDIIYYGRMTWPADFAIFGKAVAVAHARERDMASVEELKERSWKEDWPYYLRVTQPIFVDGLMADCVLLYDLIRSLDYRSFASTSSRYQLGQRNINPFLSLSQQPSVQLTYEAAQWLENRFQQVLKRKGKVDEAFLNHLPSSVVV